MVIPVMLYVNRMNLTDSPDTIAQLLVSLEDDDLIPAKHRGYYLLIRI